VSVYCTLLCQSPSHLIHYSCTVRVVSVYCTLLCQSLSHHTPYSHRVRVVSAYCTLLCQSLSGPPPSPDLDADPHAGRRSGVTRRCLLSSARTTCARGSEKKGTCTAFFPKRSKVLSQHPAPLCSAMLPALLRRGHYESPSAPATLRTVSLYCRHLGTLPLLHRPKGQTGVYPSLMSPLLCLLLTR
jgi:hypothetical protein